MKDKNLQVTWHKGPFKTLGVWFARNEEMNKLNLMEKITYARL